MLTPIAWSSDYEFGFAVLDEEHRVLTTLYNDLVRALDRRTSLSLRQEFFDSVHTCAARHFRNEELLIRRLASPEVHHHIDAHRQFLDNIARVRATATDDQALREAAHLLRQWLLSHFHEDRVLFSRLRAQHGDTV